MKNIFKSYQVCAVTALLGMLLCVGCGKQGSRFGGDMESRLDSLQSLCNSQETELSQLNDVLNVVSSTLDSLNTGQNMFLGVGNSETQKPYSKAQIRKNVQQYKELVDRQRERIKELEGLLAKNKVNGTQVQKLIAHLQEQLDEKDKQISNLMAQLNDSKQTIEQLQTSLDNMADTNVALTQQNEALASVVSAQDDAINEVYVLIADKNTLKNYGLLKGGFLQKAKLEMSNIDKKHFSATDARTFHTVTIPGEKAKIITPMPESSYTLTKTGNGSMLLEITDPAAFWGVSDFLVIQTN